MQLHFPRSLLPSLYVDVYIIHRNMHLSQIMQGYISSSHLLSPLCFCRTTGVARGPCRGSGPPSSRPGWCVQSQNMSCTSISCAVFLSCRVVTLKAAFSTVSLAWNGERQQQSLLLLQTFFFPTLSSLKVGNNHLIPQCLTVSFIYFVLAVRCTFLSLFSSRNTNRELTYMNTF